MQVKPTLLISTLMLNGCISTPLGSVTLVSTEPVPELGTRLESVEGRSGAITMTPIGDAVGDALSRSDADLLRDATVFMDIGGVRAVGTAVRLPTSRHE